MLFAARGCELFAVSWCLLPVGVVRYRLCVVVCVLCVSLSFLLFVVALVGWCSCLLCCCSGVLLFSGGVVALFVACCSLLILVVRGSLLVVRCAMLLCFVCLYFGCCVLRCCWSFGVCYLLLYVASYLLFVAAVCRKLALCAVCCWRLVVAVVWCCWLLVVVGRRCCCLLFVSFVVWCFVVGGCGALFAVV